MVPRQRQKRDVDAETDYGKVAVDKPTQNLESLRGPRPAIHPGRLGKNELRLTAAMQGRCASQSLTETVHLEGTTEQTVWLYQSVATFAGEMSYENEMSKMMVIAHPL